MFKLLGDYPFYNMLHFQLMQAIIINKLMKFNKQNKTQDKQKIMRAANKTIYIEPNYSQTHYQCQPFKQELNQPQKIRSRTNTQRLMQKTEQSPLKSISINAIKLVNEQMHHIINMEQTYAENNLRKAAKQVYQIVDNELLFNIKHLTSMKLLLYNIILIYVDEFSQHQKLRKDLRQRQRSDSINSSKNISSLKQQDISLQSFGQYQNSKQLQNLKQTIPFVPKDKSTKPKHPKIQLLEEQLSNKIQATKQSLQNILKKIEYQANYKLNGQDIMRLKKSVINVSELKPSHFLSLHTLNPCQPPKPVNIVQGSRPQSRQGKFTVQNEPISRGGSRSKTYTGGFKEAFNHTILNPRVEDITSDEQGNKLLIQQLQQIIERKENRIKQLTKQLSKNLSDQKELQKTIQNFEIQINEIQSDRKNFQKIIQKLQEQNLNYQLEIKELEQAAILRKQADKLSSSYHEESSHYNVIKEFQTRQRMMKFNIRKEIQMTIESTLNLQNESREKDINSLSAGSPFNDISEITPKRQNIDQSYILQTNVITTRKHISPQLNQNQRSHNKSVSKYQMIGGSRTQSRTQSRNKRQMNSYPSKRQQMKNSERQNYEKMIFLQALTIQQMLQDI